MEVAAADEDANACCEPVDLGNGAPLLTRDDDEALLPNLQRDADELAAVDPRRDAPPRLRHSAVVWLVDCGWYLQNKRGRLKEFILAVPCADAIPCLTDAEPEDDDHVKLGAAADEELLDVDDVIACWTVRFFTSSLMHSFTASCREVTNQPSCWMSMSPLNLR